MNRHVRLVLAGLLLASVARVHCASVGFFAGNGSRIIGPATECRLADPFGISFDKNGNAFICEMTNNRVVKVDMHGELSVFAGTTRKGISGDGGPATKAELNGPHHLLVLPNGDLLIADTWNWKIRRVEARTGQIMTFAGTGVRGFSGDGGPADKAQFSGVYSLACDAQGEIVYVADLENRRIRAINLKTKGVRTVAGTGQRGIPVDGSEAAKSALLDPRAVAVAHDGSIYILERSGHTLRVVNPDGKIRTVVGTGKAGPMTTETEPRAVTLRGPKDLCVDGKDNVLIADSDNHAIRKYEPRANRLLCIAGTGRPGAAFNSDPLLVELRQPHGVSVDAGGRVYICDSYNSRVLRIE